MDHLNKRKLQLLLVDFLMLQLSCLVAYLLNNLVERRQFSLSYNLTVFFVFTNFCLISMILAGTYRIIWRYASVIDFLILASSLFAGSLASYLVLMLFNYSLSVTLIFLSLCWQTVQ